MISTKIDSPLPSKEDLNEIQQFLLNIAEDLIVRKKEINLYPLDLLEIAKEQSDYPELELFQNITELYRSKWIVPGESQLKDQVLEKLSHEEVYYYIINHPGVDTADVMRELNISFRYALKNLETLFIFGFIRARKYSQYFLYFPSYISENEDMLYCLTRKKVARQILKFLIQKRQPATESEIIRKLGRNEFAVRRKLKKLVDFNVLELVPGEADRTYRIKKLNLNTFRAILARNGELM